MNVTTDEAPGKFEGGLRGDGSAQGLPVARPGGFEQEYKRGFGGMRCFAEVPPKP